MDERTVFLEAIEQPTPERRQEFLLQACGANAELRRKVDDLLRAHSDAGSFIEHSPVGAKTTNIRGEADDTDDRTAQFQSVNLPSASDDINLSFLSPSALPHHLGKLGQYEILEVMGRGAFGIVLRALDPKLNRVVAIKVLSPELAVNAMSVKRFRKEAQAAAAVSHDHIVTIHAVDDETSLPYIVMECILGQSLQQKIDKQGALPVSEILRIGVQIASGLAAAHKNGLVHRDIKPANILLENGVQRVKITDFGLARAVDDLAHTQTFQVAGTPQYMSPEQAHGEVIDQRSDLFSLGSVLYTMCTGRPAFRAESMMGILKRVCDDTPRPIREVNPEIPDWLAEIVARLMEKKPQDRYQSAAEVAELLRENLAEVQQHPSRLASMPKKVEPEVVRQKPWNSSRAMFVLVSLFLAAICSVPLLIVIMLAIPILLADRAEIRPSVIVEKTAGDQVKGQSVADIDFNDAPEFGWGPKSDAPWIDLLKTGELKNVMAWSKGLQWKDGALVLSSKDPKDYVQVWAEKLQLKNARMRLKAVVKDVPSSGTIKLGWDHTPGSPRRLDATLVKPAVGTTTFAAWQYDEAFSVTKLQERPVHLDWTKPIAMTCEIRNGQFTAQLGSATIQVAHGLDPEWRVVPLLGVENATLTVLEWQVQDLDAAPAPSGDPANPASMSPVNSGWRSLFNGKDLTGWHADSTGSWKVDNGILIGRAVESETFLVTDREIAKDFELKLDVKINSYGDGGVYFQVPVTESGAPVLPAYEVQLSGAIGEGYQTGTLFRQTPLAGSLGSHAADEWFTLLIRVKDAQITVSVNDRQVMEAPLNLEPNRPGHLAVQAWSTQSEVQFRKIELKEFPPAE